MADYVAQPYNDKLDSLSGISQETNRAHYGLYQKYVVAYNKAVADIASAD